MDPINPYKRTDISTPSILLFVINTFFILFTLLHR